ncbi:MAG: restriction endonuclease subunit S [Hyphomicrobiaceae bacterium]|nr:restriction endonuclease subunit S [Hyphomicrobiaceae bacterium]
MNADRLLALYEQVAEAPDAVPRLRRFLLDLAVRGKLGTQDASDEPASDLLTRIAAEKARIVREGKFKTYDGNFDRNPNAFPFSVPSNWSWCYLDDLAAVARGGSPRPIKSFITDDPNGIPWIKIGDSTRGSIYIDGTQERIKPEGLAKSRLVIPGDLLLSNSMSFGFPYITNVEGCIHDGWLVIRTPERLIDKLYLHSVFLSDHAKAAFSEAASGAVVQNLNADKARQLAVPLPPLVEQRRIVAKVEELMALLDRLEAARTAREATRDRLTAASLARLTAPDTNPAEFPANARFALATLPALTTRPDLIKPLRQTILNLAVRGKLVEQDPNDEPVTGSLAAISAKRDDMVRTKKLRREKPLKPARGVDAPFQIPSTWQWVRVGELSLFTQYGTSAKAAPSEMGIPVLTMGNIQEGAVVRTNEKRIPETSDELPGLYLKDFDLLYNRTNSAELVGKTGLYRGDDDCLTFASYLIRIHLSSDHTSPIYVNLAMNAPDFRETQIVPHIKKQTGQANVSGSALKNMLIPLPPLAEQHRIVAKVDALMALCDRLEATLTTTDTTRARLLEALLHEALSPAVVAVT